MTKKITATVAAAAIAMTGMTATPAKALTPEEEALLLFAGLAAVAILSGSTPTPPPAPPIRSAGPLLLKQTYSANLDNGAIAAGPGSDILFQYVSPTKRFIKPRNGAKMAVGDKSNRGYFGCATESFSAQRVNINQLPVGSWVCMKTGAGRISQFRVKAKFGGPIKKMKIRYTTWQ